MITSPDILAAKLPAWLQEDALQPHWVAGASSPAPEPVTQHEPNPYPKPGVEPTEPALEPRRKFDHGRMMSWNFEPEKWKRLFDDDLPIPTFTPKTTTRPPPVVRSFVKVPFDEYDDEYDYEDYEHNLIDPTPPTRPLTPPVDDCPPCSQKCDGVNGI